MKKDASFIPSTRKFLKLSRIQIQIRISDLNQDFSKNITLDFKTVFQIKIRILDTNPGNQKPFESYYYQLLYYSIFREFTVFPHSVSHGVVLNETTHGEDCSKISREGTRK